MKNGYRAQTILILVLALTSSGCMQLGMMPMKIGPGRDHPGAMLARPAVDLEVADNDSGTLEIFDRLIDELVTDLSSRQLDIAVVAVWRLSAQPDDDYRETVRQKLITQLVASHAFTVVTRERLRELLKEQGLSETGAIDEETATGIGALIGVDGFIDGYLSVSKDLYVLSLSLIDAQSGVIIWAKTVDKTAS